MNGYESTWRDIVAPTIARVIREVGTADPKRLSAALRAAYPYGVRKYHPYRIWCNEIRRQLHPEQFPPRRRGAYTEAARDARQSAFF